VQTVHYIATDCTLNTVHVYPAIKAREMVVICSTNGGEEKHTEVSGDSGRKQNISNIHSKY
jgi:hypothetical protein